MQESPSSEPRAQPAARFTILGATIGVLAHGLITFLVLFMAGDASDGTALLSGVLPWTSAVFVAYVAAVAVSYTRGRRRLALVIACCPFPALMLVFAVLTLLA